MKAGLFTIIAIVLIMSGMTLIVMGYAPKEPVDLDNDGIPDAQDDYVPAPPDETGNGGTVPPDEPPIYYPPLEPPPDPPPDHPPDEPPEPPPDYEYPPFTPSVKLPRLDLPDIDVNMQVVGFVLVLLGLMFLAFPSKGW